jgi:hypothetical protein
MFLYVYFSEEEADAELHGRRRSLSSPDRTFRRARRAIRLLIIVVAFAFAVMLVSAVILNRFPWYSQEWANVLGICVACFACVQWVPQVWTTIHLGHLGSLSLASICMGAPVSFYPLPPNLPESADLTFSKTVYMDLRHQHDHPSRLRRLVRLDRLCPGRNHATHPHYHRFHLHGTR